METEILKENQAVARAIAQALKDERILDISLIAAGATNRSYVLRTDKDLYALRVPGAGAEALIDRRQEKEIYDQLGNTGLCDTAVYMDIETGIKISKFLKDSRQMDIHREQDFVLFLRTIKALHALALKCDARYDFYEKIQEYETLRKRPSVFPDYDMVKAEILSLKPFTDAYADQQVLIHNDLSPENCLMVMGPDGEERCVLIDLEYAAMLDPLADIAYFCVFTNMDEEQTDHIIKLYFEREPTVRERARVYAYVALNGLAHSNWLEFKASLGEVKEAENREAFAMAKKYCHKTKNLLKEAMLCQE